MQSKNELGDPGRKKTKRLLHRPRIMFLDEPTIGLDVLARLNLKRFLMVAISHYLPFEGIYFVPGTIYVQGHLGPDIAGHLLRQVIWITVLCAGHCCPK